MFVFIHGGGFQQGGTEVPIYDGEGLAGKGLVVVTINYRVGVFGILAYPELTKSPAIRRQAITGCSIRLPHFAGFNSTSLSLEAIRTTLRLQGNRRVEPQYTI